MPPDEKTAWQRNREPVLSQKMETNSGRWISAIGRRWISTDRRLWVPATLLLIATVASLRVMWYGYHEPASPPTILSPGWFVAPLEWNATSRLPYLDVHLNCIHSTPDGQKIWLVGDGGLVLYSGDSGSTWVEQGDASLREGEAPVAAAAPAFAPAPVPPGEEAPAPAPVPPAATKRESKTIKALDQWPDGITYPQVFAQVPPEKIETLTAQNKQNEPAAAAKEADKAEPAKPPAVPMRKFFRNWLGVAFDDTGDKGFVVSYGGDVYHTVDRGKTWKRTASIYPVYEFWVSAVHRDDIRFAGYQTRDFGGRVDRDDHAAAPAAAGGLLSGDPDQRVVHERFPPKDLLKRSFRTEFNWLPGTLGGRPFIDLGVQSTKERGDWFVGTDGRLSWRPHDSSSDGLLTWKPNISTSDDLQTRILGPQSLIHSLWVAPANSNAAFWLCGADGLLMRSTDDGVTWVHRSRTKDHVGNQAATVFTLPPPWYYPVALACLGWMLSVLLKRREPLAEEWMADRPKGAELGERLPGERFPKGFDPDKPVEFARDDTLGFADIAHGLSRFLRNQDTKPPLSIAITGPWGMGKSSIMGMLKHDLESHDFPVVWFNAWHHQKEASLLAALLQNLNLQAIWPWYTLKGLRLRWELIRRRLSASIWIPMLLGGVLFFGWLWAQPNRSLVLWHDINELVAGTSKGATSDPPADRFLTWVFSIIGVGGVGATVRWLWKAAQGLGVDPAKLVQEGRSASVATSREQIGFRYEFAKDFHRLTGILSDAFQTRITVFIDDLDRCEPAHIREILEAVNFLVSSGDCFVVLGMDYQRVKDSVGHGFRDSVMDADGLHDDDETKRADARKALDQFAARYMEKLVNIVVPVPQPDDVRLRKLVAAKEETSRDGSPPIAQQSVPVSRKGNRILVATFVLLLAIFLYWGGRNLGTTPVAVAKPVPRVQSRDVMRIKIWGQTLIVRSVENEWTVEFEQKNRGPAPAIVAPVLPVPINMSQPAEAQLAGNIWSTMYFGGLVLLLPVIVALIWLWRSRVIHQEWVVKDSEEFTTALQHWYALYRERRSSPRAIKRFANRVRYYAMRVRSGDASKPPTVSDAKLVALVSIDDYLSGVGTSLQPLIPDLWKGVLDPDETAAHYTLHHELTDNSEAASTLAAIRSVIDEHVNKFPASWPPTEDEVAIVRHLAAGIHLA